MQFWSKLGPYWFLHKVYYCCLSLKLKEIPPCSRHLALLSDKTNRENIRLGKVTKLALSNENFSSQISTP